MDSNELGTDNYMLKHLSLVPASLCCANYSAIPLVSQPYTPWWQVVIGVSEAKSQGWHIFC